MHTTVTGAFDRSEGVLTELIDKAYPDPDEYDDIHERTAALLSGRAPWFDWRVILQAGDQLSRNVDKVMFRERVIEELGVIPSFA